MKNKRGLSAIVATLLIILLAIISFAIVSVVIKNTVGSSSEKIELGQKCLDIEMHSTGITKYVGTTYYDIGFTRGDLSGATLDGIKVVLTDLEDNIISEDLVKQIDPLEKWTENMSFSDGENFFPAKITIIPYFMKESGDIYYCEGISFTDEINLVNDTSSFTGSVIAPLTGNNVILLNLDFSGSENPNEDLNLLNVRYPSLSGVLDKLSLSSGLNEKSKEVGNQINIGEDTTTTFTNPIIAAGAFLMNLGVYDGDSGEISELPSYVTFNEELGIHISIDDSSYILFPPSALLNSEDEIKNAQDKAKVYSLDKYSSVFDKSGNLEYFLLSESSTREAGGAVATEGKNTMHCSDPECTHYTHTPYCCICDSYIVHCAGVVH